MMINVIRKLLMFQILFPKHIGRAPDSVRWRYNPKIIDFKLQVIFVYVKIIFELWHALVLGQVF